MAVVKCGVSCGVCGVSCGCGRGSGVADCGAGWLNQWRPVVPHIISVGVFCGCG